MNILRQWERNKMIFMNGLDDKLRKYINENNKIYVWINTSIITKELPLLKL